MDTTPTMPTRPAPTEDTDLHRAYTPGTLAEMSVAQLEELWLAEPEQHFYQDAFDQVIRDLSGDDLVSDVQRLALLETALEAATGQEPHFPIGERDGHIFYTTLRYGLAQRVTAPDPAPPASEDLQAARPNIQLMVVIGAVILILLCLAVGITRRLVAAPQTQAELTATSAASTQAVLNPATATPLALDDLDRTVGGGDNLRDRYPVTLALVTAAGAQRVFPIQQREIAIAEWQYDPSPAIATAVYGLVIRPVIGIPYSPENRAYLATLQAGDRITLSMSTGQTLPFLVTHSTRVQPQEQSIFDQRAPGIVIVLLGESTPDRLVVYGLPTAEASLLADSGGAAAPGQAVAHGESGLMITALAASTSVGPETSILPPEWMYLLVDLRVHSGSGSLNTGDLLIYASDASGNRYSPVAVDPTLTRHQPFTATALGPNAELDATLAFLIPRGLADASLLIQLPRAQVVTYDLAYAQPIALDATDLDVLILDVETQSTAQQPDSLLVRVRLYNPHHVDIQVRAPDVYVVYAPAALGDETFPVGPTQQPTSPQDLPLTIRAGHAVDIDIIFQWSGDPVVGLAIGGYRYVIQLRQP